MKVLPIVVLALLLIVGGWRHRAGDGGTPFRGAAGLIVLLLLITLLVGR